MPYEYYEFVRFVSAATFLLFAIQAYKKGDQSSLVVFIILSALFQPFFKVHLGRYLWNVVDVIVAIGLIISIFRREEG